MKKIISLLLVLIMVFSVCIVSGCGEDKETAATPEATATVAPKTDADLIVGKWEVSLDFGEYMKKELAEDQEMGAYINDIESLVVKGYSEFKADGTYTESYEDGFEPKLTTWMRKLYTTMFTKMLTDMAEENGTTIEAMLELMEFDSIDAYVDAVLEEMDVAEMFDIKAINGTYTIKDGTLTMIEPADEESEEEKTEFKYTLTEDTLTFTECDNEDASILLPMTYKKIG